MEYIGTLFFIVIVILGIDLLYNSGDLGGYFVKLAMRMLGLYGEEKHQGEDESFIGAYAEVSRPFEQIGIHFQGHVKLNGVEWKALCKNGKLSPGTIVVVKNMSNLTLEVKPK